jgi:hypothetical protein
MTTTRRVTAILQLVLLGCTSRPSDAFNIPNQLQNKATACYKTSSCLSVAVQPTIHPANSTSDDNPNDHNKNGQSPLYANVQEANRALDALAMKCGSPSLESVIARADECQSQWENMRLTSVPPDTVSLNIVLKAWGKCCQSLADYKKQAAVPAAISNQAVDVGVHNDHPPVYTAKDAAERATLLLLSQEQDYQNEILPESARPDAYSYNEVIGMYLSN